MRLFIIISGIVLFFLPDFCEGQNFYARRRDRRLVISAGTGLSSYYGDLNPQGKIIDFKPNLDLGLRYRLVDRFSIRANAIWYRIAGDDANYKENTGQHKRNLSFRSDNFEVSGSIIVSLFPTNERLVSRKSINPYALAGFGITYFNPKARYQGDWHPLRPLQTEGVNYNSFTPVIPFGLGVNFKVAPFLNLALEGGYRKTFTDYLDDVSTDYRAPSSFESDLARALADRGPEIGEESQEGGDVRGNPEADDGYLILNLKIEYYFPYNKFTGLFQRRGRY